MVSMILAEGGERAARGVRKPLRTWKVLRWVRRTPPFLQKSAQASENKAVDFRSWEKERAKSAQWAENTGDLFLPDKLRKILSRGAANLRM
jgi:hypothetical protein